MFTRHAHVHKTCTCSQDMHMFTRHAHVHKTCYMFTRHAHVHKTCTCSQDMHMFTRHAQDMLHVHKTCTCSQDMHMFTRHVTCSQDMHMFTRHAHVHKTCYMFTRHAHVHETCTCSQNMLHVHKTCKCSQDMHMFTMHVYERAPDIAQRLLTHGRTATQYYYATLNDIPQLVTSHAWNTILSHAAVITTIFSSCTHSKIGTTTPGQGHYYALPCKGPVARSCIAGEMVLIIHGNCNSG